MNWNKYLVAIVVFCYASPASSQYIQHYKIIYEKKINMSKLSKWWRSTDKDGKFWKDNFSLTTNSQYSIYERIEKDISEESNWVYGHISYSQTYIDIQRKTQISQKEVSEMTFLLTDSLPKLEWHIYDEVRTIAGYPCRKAMAKFRDSVDVVAYFTEQLYSPIGPESVTGLPGTILGMVIPMFETTWLATSIESLENQPVKSIVPPKKGTPTDKKKLEEVLMKSYKDYDQPHKLVLRLLL